MKIETIHEDERGKIFLLTEDLREHKEITIFTANKGYARGGCIHNEHDEHCVVLEGQIKYFIGNKETPKTMIKGQSILIPKATPHYFVAKTDCIVMEWGALPSEKKCKHPEFRAYVDKINAEMKK
jgi:quercetin dioxygenase-like cupin family protein